ncbi:MAG: hypothetical protein COB53_13335 [Elusimicrobia bacterium]|nr:MAG: hypothetical protein COB53_13335 [Elusimicrobiota bacterium]
MKIRNNKGFTPHRFFKKSGEGFTLIELLVVVAIIGLLSSIVFASLDGARDKARGALIASDFKEIEKALLFHYDKFGTYPVGNGNDSNGSNSLETTLQPFLDNGFMSEIPHHPLWPNNTISSQYYLYWDKLQTEALTNVFTCGNHTLSGFTLLVIDVQIPVPLSYLTSKISGDILEYVYCITE